MKYLTFLALTVIMFTWMACGHGRPVETTESTPPVTPANSTVQPQAIPANTDASNTSSTPLTTPVTIPTATPSTIFPTGKATAGLNPEHGQPGHRCDIAVGAPLNSQPSQPTTPAISTPITTPAIQPTVQTTPTKAVAPGMNPEHGQPGHRCDIAVGAPLDSKPTAASVPSVVPQAPANNQVIPSVTPVKPVPDTKKDNR